MHLCACAGVFRPRLMGLICVCVFGLIVFLCLVCLCIFVLGFCIFVFSVFLCMFVYFCKEQPVVQKVVAD